MKIMKKIGVAFIIVVFAGTAGWRFYSREETGGRPAGAPRRPPVPVEAAPVRTEDIRSVKRFSGTLLPVSSFVAAPKVSGRIERIFVDIGDEVERGQLLALLDDREYVQDLEQARAELEVARANLAEAESLLEAAERDFGRAGVLRERGIASESELEEAEANFKTRKARKRVAEAQVQQRVAALGAAELRLSFTRIKASWDGGGDRRVVGERYADEGGMVPANSPVVSVLDIDTLTAVVHVTEKDYYSILPGSRISLRADARPGREFEGEVVRVAPVLREASRSARVEARVLNPGRLLKPGMFVNAEIEMARSSNASVVPLEALTTYGGRRGVFLLDDEKTAAGFVPVSEGISTPESVEIIRPEISGYVVTLGQHLLEDGAQVLVAGGRER